MITRYCTSPNHPGRKVKMICPVCNAQKGGRSRAKSADPKKLREWGKSGGNKRWGK